ncbi:2-C-methyl-D-erythritol 4-phosphate cytidylyltransferase [Candidatus Haliotispira prima]|uniref:2-C-methyl-D-erythritol 4-phosphate cytidylyltransferase n=1 Tax=Candidatus Haliotispira prima TaxID=3034016 RepID=A0ABY8MKA6_9SPIO|nr:2-C-methyl-D-erythritol 4-phosphate cytidylyltransferase [Candidatus Haliotispira prima]
MPSSPLNIAIILAGGIGCRAAQNPALPPEQDQPKQLWPLGGLPVWQHSWLSYATHPAIQIVCLVWPENYVSQIRQALTQYTQTQHPDADTLATSYVIAGGRERSDSSSKALEFSQQWQERDPQRRIQVLIHDAARPLVSRRIIDETLRQLKLANAAVCAIPAQDSLFVKEDSEGCKVGQVLDRSTVMQSQTPQSFELQTLRRAFAIHQEHREIAVTDDICLIKSYLPSQDIRVVEGDIYNMKLTQAADLKTLTSYYQMITTQQ